MEKPQFEVKVILGEEQKQQIYTEYLSDLQSVLKSVKENNGKRYMYQKELMNYLRIGMATLNEMIDNGLPYVWLGNKKMFNCLLHISVSLHNGLVLQSAIIICSI